MKHPFQAQIPMMTLYTTLDELIALGIVVTEYLTQSERILNKTKEHLEMIMLLRSFQGRLVHLSQNSREV